MWIIILSSVALGVGAAFLVSTTSHTFKYLLSFSGAFLFATLITHLLPEVFSSHNTQMGWWILGGFAVQLLLDYLSGGLEHGHYHHNHHQVPWLALTGLFLHAFIEGMPLELHDHLHSHDHGSNTPLIWAVALHKIPIALLVTAALRRSEIHPATIVAIMTLFALSTPAGAQLQHIISASPDLILKTTALTTGLLLHVSTTILFESSQDHKFNLIKLLFVFTGLLLAASINS